MITFILNLYVSRKIQFKNIIEFVLMLTERKTTIRLVGDLNLYHEIKSEIHKHGFSCEKSDFMLRTVKKTYTDDHFHEYVHDENNHDGELVIYIGANDKAAEAKYAEANDFDDNEISKIYGYPTCCAAAYQDIVQDASWVNVFFNAPQGLYYPYQANKVANLIPPYLSLHKDYFPCGIDCKQSIEDCKEAEAALKEVGLDYLLDKIIDHLTGLCLIFDKNLYFFWDYTLTINGYIILDKGWHTPISPNSGKPKRVIRIEVNDQHVIIHSKKKQIHSFYNSDNENYFVIFQNEKK